MDPREVMVDTLADGQPLLVLFGRYDGDLEGQRQVIEHPQSVFGLSDSGAHCGVLVDASVPTYMVSYFTRDRQRGPRMPLEFEATDLGAGQGRGRRAGAPRAHQIACPHRHDPHRLGFLDGCSGGGRMRRNLPNSDSGRREPCGPTNGGEPQSPSLLKKPLANMLEGRSHIQPS